MRNVPSGADQQGQSSAGRRRQICERRLVGEVADIADETPLAYLTAAPGGGLALLVRPGGDITHVWLPELTDAEVARRAWACFRVQGSPGWASEMDGLMQWLW